MQPMMGVAAPPKPPRGGLTSLLAGILSLVVAGLLVGGSFGTISTFRQLVPLGGPDAEKAVFAGERTWWSFSDAGSTNPNTESTFLGGLVLVLAAALLLLGAVYAFVASRTCTPGAVAASRSLIVAGAAVLIGGVLIVLFDVLDAMDNFNRRELAEGESVDFHAEIGLYLPLGAILLGIVAVVLAHVGQRPHAVRVEPNTPRMGFPAPYGQRPYGQPGPAPVAPSERPTEVELPQPATSPSADSSVDDPDGAEETQVVSNATVTQTDTPPSVAAALSGEPSAAPPAPVSPPAPVAPADPEPTPLTDLPAAPPAPELSSSDDKKND